MKKLEIYYLANKSENLYFALLGDCTLSKNENEDFDDEIINQGLEEVKKLNDKYDQNLNKYIPKFNFLYRRRTWNSSEKCYIGWERKRGLLCQFNEYLIDGKNPFRINTIQNNVGANSIYTQKKIEKNYYSNLKNDKSKKIKYVITLDSDTNLPLETGLQLIGSMAHILNSPVLDENKNVVIDGYGIMQPRIGTDLESSRKNLFTKIYTGVRRYRFLYKRNF